MELSRALVSNKAAGQTHSSARGRAPVPLQHSLPWEHNLSHTNLTSPLLHPPGELVRWFTTVKKWITILSLSCAYIRNLGVCQDRGKKLGRKKRKMCKKR